MLLNLQYVQTSIEGPVEGDFDDSWAQIHPTMFPWSLPHLEILGAKVIGTRTHRKNIKNKFIQMINGNKKCTAIKWLFNTMFY